MVGGMIPGIILPMLIWQKVTYDGTDSFLDKIVIPEGFTKEQFLTNPTTGKAYEIGEKLDRGATYLHGEGSYSHRDTKVVLTAVKKQQVAELKDLVIKIDPDAFIIVQEAHQVLGDGFARHTKDSL